MSGKNFISKSLNCSEEILINYACKCQKISKGDLGSLILDQNERKMFAYFCPNCLLKRGPIKRINTLDYFYSTTFKRQGQKLGNFLVELKTPQFAFDIFWLLLRTPHWGKLHALKSIWIFEIILTHSRHEFQILNSRGGWEISR